MLDFIGELLFVILFELIGTIIVRFFRFIFRPLRSNRRKDNA